MDCRAVAKKSNRWRKNVDNTQQVKDSVYFSDDTILEAIKFLKYKKWSQMRFLCRRVNQLIHSNQSKLQAFEVTSLSMSEEIGCRRNAIVSFDQGIQPAVAVRKWFQDRGYSCDETVDMPLNKVFNLSFTYGCLHLTIRALYLEPIEKNMPLTRDQAKRMGKARKNSRRLPNAVAMRSKPPQVFSAKFDAEYEFYGPTLSHFFRLLHHPTAYFREVSMFPPMTDKFCDEASKNLIRCKQFTLMHLDSSLEHSLKWLKDNVRAQIITLSFTHTDKIAYIHLLLSEFFLQDASICVRDRIKLDLTPEPEEFVNALIKKYETLEATKTVPSIVLEFKMRWSRTFFQFFELNFVPIDYPLLYDERCDKCFFKTFERPIKSDGSLKMIAQVRRCFEIGCLYYSSIFHVRFE